MGKIEKNKEISEKEQNIFQAKKNEIEKLTKETSILLEDIYTNKNQILNLLTKISANVADLSAINNFMNAKSILNYFKREFKYIQVLFNGDLSELELKERIQQFCYNANIVTLGNSQFDNQRKSIVINIKEFHFSLLDKLQ